MMRFRGAYSIGLPLRHVTCVVSRRHFIVSKDPGDGVFKEGQRLCEQQRFSEALLQHAASHAS